MTSLFIISGVYLAAGFLASSPAVASAVLPLFGTLWWHGLGAKFLTLAALAATLHWRLLREELSWEDIGWRKGFSRRELAWSLWGALAVFITLELLWLFRDAAPNEGSINAWSELDLSRTTHQIGALLGIGLLTGIKEELFYRGAIIGLLRRRLVGGRPAEIAAIAASSLIFASLHGLSSAYAFFVYVLLGAVLSLVYLRSDSLKSVLLAHILSNSIRVIRMIFA